MLGGSIKVKRKNEPGKLERAVKWDVAVGIAEKTLKSRIGTVARAPYKALELLKSALSDGAGSAKPPEVGPGPR